jgi:hypothetical protein
MTFSHTVQTKQAVVPPAVRSPATVAREREKLTRDRDARERAQAARDHQAFIRREARERREALIAPLVNRWRTFVGDALDLDPGEISTFGELASEVELGDEIVRARATQVGFERSELESMKPNGQFSAEELEALRDDYISRVPSELHERDTARHYFFVRDLKRCAPPDAAPQAFAEAYRATIPGMDQSKMIVIVQPGAPVVFVGWSDEPIAQSAVERWCATVEGGERFEALDRLVPFGEPVVLEATRPVHAATAPTLAGLAAPSRAPATLGIRTGIAPLDSQFRAGGVPEGSFVVAQAPPGHLKTTLLLAMACELAGRGLNVAWLACGDEPADRVLARLAQRGTPVPASLYVIDASPDVTLEAVLACGPDALFVDSLQAYAGGSLQGLDAAIKTIRTSRRTVFATSELARDAYQGTRRRAAIAGGKGSGSIEYRATTLLDLRYDRDAGVLRVALPKNRDGSQDAFELVPDLTRQTMTAFGDELKPETEAEARIWVAVRTALTERGPQTRRWIRDNVKGKAATVHAVVVDRIESGALVLRDDGGVSLAEEA